MADQKYTRADVAGRNGRNGAPLWIIYKDVVYDMSAYIQEHPGGEDPIRDEAGKDATKEFEAVGHSEDARTVMRKYKVGEIVEKKKKVETKGPVKSASQLFPPKKPGPAGPPGKLPARPSTGLPSTSSAPSGPLNVSPTSLPDIPIDSSITVPDGPPEMQGYPPQAVPAFAPALTPTCTPTMGFGAAVGASNIPLGTANVPPQMGAPMEPPIGPSAAPIGSPPPPSAPTGSALGQLGPTSSQPGETLRVSINTAASPTGQDAPNTKPSSSDISVESNTREAPQPMSPSQANPPDPSSTPTSPGSSEKPPIIQPVTSSISSGLSKVSITPGNTASNPLPWATTSQPAKPKPAFKSLAPANAKKTSHNPFKKDKMPISSFKKK